MRIVFLAVLATALFPLRGVAQRVAGIVVEQGTGTPVPGVMVLLLDSAGTRVDRTLTNAAGRFLVRARTPGVHRMSVQRIGFADWTSDAFRPGGLREPLRIEFPFEPVSLEGLDISGGRRCEARPEAGAATARVWQEARKALAAEAYTRETGHYRYTLRHYKRELDRGGRKTLAETITTAKHLRAAFFSSPIDELATRGFVQATDSSQRYYAPDAETLLSDTFLDTHCFGVRQGHAGRIGLTFQPLPDRRVSEIEGVLWLNAATWQLERLEFRYRNLFQGREVGNPGGEVSFTQLPNGAWIVRDWSIRMPNLEQVIRGRLRRVGYTEDAGVTWAITSARGRPILHAESASIFGVVTNAGGTGAPSEPVVVQVRGTNEQALTAKDGSFLLVGLMEGRHLLAVQHPLLADWGVDLPVEVEAEGRLGEVAHVRLRAPALADALATSCGGAPRPERTAAFLGRVTSPGGAPVDGMAVAVSWPGTSGYEVPPAALPARPETERDRTWHSVRKGVRVTASTTTDWRGLFLLCDVPGGLRLDVAVGSPGGTEPVLTETYTMEPDAGAVVETLVLPAGVETRTPTGAARRTGPVWP